MLTRAGFDAACKTIVDPTSPALTGWSWNEHPSPSTDDQLVIQDDHDEAEAVMKGVPETLFVTSCCMRSRLTNDVVGSPLPLADLVHTTLFHPLAFEHTEFSTFGITRPQSSFPLLSQGDHPTLGIPCWYLHPCATNQAVDELMAETGAADSEDVEIVRLRWWLETWFM
ncbi:hypothetical protein C0992_000836, partial [Termitomyces sp. T32_za158]